VLKTLFHSQVSLGLAQAAIAASLALAVVFLARRRHIHLESDTAVALLRGIVQIAVVGSLLALLLKAPRWSSVFLLAGMLIAEGRSPPAARKISPEPGRYPPSPSRPVPARSPPS
jgi:putative ABC transport system permease protein